MNITQGLLTKEFKYPPGYYVLFFNKRGCFKNQVKSERIIK